MYQQDIGMCNRPIGGYIRVSNVFRRAKRTSVSLGQCLLITSCTGLHDPQPLRPLNCVAVAGATGTVEGSVVSDSTGAPIADRRVWIDGANCRTRTDSLGLFRLAGVPAGRFELRVGDLWFRRLPPMPIVVRSGDTITLQIRLRPQNGVLDCADVSFCAQFLIPHPSAATLSLEDQLHEAALRTTFAMALGLANSLGWTPCFDVESETILRVLQARIPRATTIDNCALPEKWERLGPSPETHLRDLRTGAPARRIRASRPQREGATTAVGGGSYFYAPLWAEGYRCRYELRADGWRAVWCAMTWIS